jgi:hypothetical protein
VNGGHLEGLRFNARPCVRCQALEDDSSPSQLPTRFSRLSNDLPCHSALYLRASILSMEDAFDQLDIDLTFSRILDGADLTVLARK